MVGRVLGRGLSQQTTGIGEEDNYPIGWRNNETIRRDGDRARRRRISGRRISKLEARISKDLRYQLFVILASSFEILASVGVLDSHSHPHSVRSQELSFAEVAAGGSVCGRARQIRERLLRRTPGRANGQAKNSGAFGITYRLKN
jgi:hypothetical protein